MIRDGQGTADTRNANDLGSETSWLEWRARAAAYCRAFHGLSPEEREDIAGEAVSRAWAARDRFDSARPFAPWFFTIVRRLALDAVEKSRGKGMEDSAAPLGILPSPQAEAEEVAVRESEARFVRGFVDALPEPDRELASLVYGQGFRVAKAARVTGIPVGSAKWRLHEIRKALRGAWEEEYGRT